MTKTELYYTTHYLAKGIKFLNQEELIELSILLDKAKSEVEKAKKKLK